MQRAAVGSPFRRSTHQTGGRFSVGNAVYRNGGVGWLAGAGPAAAYARSFAESLNGWRVRPRQFHRVLRAAWGMVSIVRGIARGRRRVVRPFEKLGVTQAVSWQKIRDGASAVSPWAKWRRRWIDAANVGVRGRLCRRAGARGLGVEALAMRASSWMRPVGQRWAADRRGIPCSIGRAGINDGAIADDRAYGGQNRPGLGRWRQSKSVLRG